MCTKRAIQDKSIFFSVCLGLQSQCLSVFCTLSCADLLLFKIRCAQESIRELVEKIFCNPIPIPAVSSSHLLLDQPLFFALIYGFCKIWIIVHNSGICTLSRFCPLGFIGMVGSLVAEHISNEEHQGAENGEDHNSNNT